MRLVLFEKKFAFAVDASFYNACQLYRKAENDSPLDYSWFIRRIVQFQQSMAPLLLFQVIQLQQSFWKKGFFQEYALTAKIIFFNQPKSNPCVLCARKIPGRCAKSRKSICTNFALKDFTSRGIINSKTDIS